MPLNIGGFNISEDTQDLVDSILVPTEGLALYLDVNNPGSYPGAGNIWTDLAQGLEFTSLGTQTPYETKGGALSFAFNGSGYWQCDVGYEQVDMAGPYTLIMWIYSEDLGERDTIFEKVGPVYNSYEHEIAVTYEVNEALSWYSRYASYDSANTGNANLFMDISSWNMMGIKTSTGKIQGTSRTGTSSKNGGVWTDTLYAARSTNKIIPARQIRIGTGYAGAVENGNIGMVMVYNREISDAEISEVFNNTRSIFGL